MARYYHSNSYYKQKRYLQRFRKAFIAVVLFVILLGGGVWFWITSDFRQAQQPSAPSRVTTTTISSPVEIFQTEYFQFQADADWHYMEKESNPNKYVYRQIVNTLIQHEITILIDTPTPDRPVSYVLPVEQTTDFRLKAAEISTHCRQSLPSGAARDPRILRHAGVEMLCTPENLVYSVVLGLKGGKAPMELRRPNGQKALYGIYYRNLTIHNNDRELVEMTKTFQVR